jgi:small conductance mechanosensitive channel
MPDIINSFYFYKAFFSLITLIVAFLISLFVGRSIDLVIAGVGRTVSQKKILARTRTIRTILKNLVEGAIIVIAILIVLAQWGVDIRPILTGAGIIGLAISLGSQSLVKDFISGFFIISNGEFNVGDRVKIGDYEGEVQEINLRMTVLRDENGSLIYIPNSQIAAIVKYRS